MTPALPARHAGFVPDLTLDTPWRRTFHALRDKLGTGFTAALCGGRGNGKTQMAVLLCQCEKLERRGTASFATATDFLMDVKATYRQGSDKCEADVLRDYLAPTLLVLDEFDKRAGTEWEQSLLFHLLNHRYNAVKDTLLVSNLAPDAFKALVGESVASRMQEGGGIVECAWPSFRGAAAPRRREEPGRVFKACGLEWGPDKGPERGQFREGPDGDGAHAACLAAWQKWKEKL